MEDVAFRVIARQPAARSRDDRAVPCSATRTRWPGCSVRCWRCAREAGLVQVGVIAVDGTKVHANASERATRGYEQIAREILEEAEAVDAAEDERFGDARGDELPERARDRRRVAQRWLREAKRRLDERARRSEAQPIRASPAGAARGGQAPPGRGAPGRVRANEAYEAYARPGAMQQRPPARRAHARPSPTTPPPAPQGKINITDPDSRNVKTPRGWVQGYNAQAVANERSDRDRRRDRRPRRRTSGTWSRWSTPPAASCAPPASTETPERGARRRRLLAQRQMQRARRRRHPGPDPARRQQAQGRPAGLGRRPLRVHAPRPRDRARRRALPPTPTR